jgi:hypothetical protein
MKKRKKRKSDRRTGSQVLSETYLLAILFLLGIKGVPEDIKVWIGLMKTLRNM